MLTYVLYTLFVAACFILILVVLLQPGKGDAATAFGGGVSGAAFGPRGTTTLLAKITIGAAVGFMVIGWLLSIPGFITDRSVVSGVDPAPAAVPADPAAIPVEGLPAAPVEGSPAPAPGDGTAVPAGQLQVTPEGQVQGQPPAQPAPDTKPEKPAAKPAEAPKK